MAFKSATLPLMALVGLTFAGTVSAQTNYSQRYAPQYVECPSDVQWSRPADGLSDQEQSWVNGRKRVVLPALKDYLGRLNITGLDLDSYLSALGQNTSDVPSLGLAISGGGYNSAFTGTGALRAMDNRNPEAVEQKTGGLLQCLTYLSGLSGGSWPTLSFPSHGFPTADELIDYWQPQITRSTNVTTQYSESVTDIFEDLTAKYQAGFNISLADFLGRLWASEYLPSPYGGIDVTMSSLAQQPNFLTYEMPMSIIQLTEVADWDPEYYEILVPTANSTMYEVTPFEFGAWEGSVASFTPTKWLGTRLTNGAPINNDTCVQGFDKASFIMGSTSDAVNFWELEVLSNYTLGGFAKRDTIQSAQSISRVKRYSSAAWPKKPTPVKRDGSAASLVTPLVGAFQEYFNLNFTSIMYSIWPNPFAGLDTSAGYTQTATDLRLVDGSTSGQAIPFWAQLYRHMDLIVAWDSNGDSLYDWMNGTNLYNTFQAASASGVAFPIIPPVNTFINYNYSKVPTFFGCDANLTTTGAADTPIVLHIPNAPYSAYTNYSYFQTTFSRGQMFEIFENSFNEVTRGNGTLLPGDEMWTTCIGCAAIDRSLMRLGMARPEICESCFASYCWNGTVDNSKPAEIDPSLLLDPGTSFAEWNKTSPL